MSKRHGLVFLLLAALMVLVATSALTEEQIDIDAENGIWQYEAPGLRIDIKRVVDREEKLIWYEVHLYCSKEKPLTAMVTNPKKPGITLKNPIWIARQNQLVFALSDDFFGYRIYCKHTVGVIIRDGKIVSSKTYKKSGTGLPNLDTMAIYSDGSMAVYQCSELTAQEYVDKGAEAVLSFGPILVRDGVMDERLSSSYKSLEPRVGFGYVAPYHYVAVVVEGRHKESRGAGLAFVAEKLMDMGAVNALNLDGGQTSALVFMGEKLNKTGEFRASSNVRTLSGMLAAGYCEQVPGN